MNSARGQLIVLWLISTLLILCHTANWMTDTFAVALCDGVPTLATTETWMTPLSRWPEVVNWLQWPGYVYAAVAGLLVIQAIRVESNPWNRLFGLIGLSLLCSPPHLIPGCLVLLLSFGPGNTSRWKPIVVLGLAILTTLEYGLISLLVAVAIAARISERGFWYRRLLPVTTGLAAIAGAIIWLPGFGQTLLRPVIALTVNPPGELMNSLRTLSGLREHWLSWVCLLPTLLNTGRTLGQKSAPAFRTAVWCVLLISGLSCSCYSFLAVIGMLQLTGEFPAMPQSEKRFGWVLAMGVVAAAVSLAATTTGRFSTGQLSHNERFRLERWETQGLVALLDLERSREWQTPSTFERFPLMASDRWELCHDRLRDYYAFCQDITEGREHRYLRQDNSFGGYKLWTRNQSVAFLALETTDVDSIRRISVSPDWRIIGIDGEQVLFGNSAITSNRMLIRQASEELLACEWKGKLPTGEGAVVIGRESSRPTLAAVICSTKFPYAALHLLAGVKGRAAEHVRASCLLELTHRVAGHASQLSLLDHYRAQVLVAKVLSDGVNSETRLRLTRGMLALESRLPPVDICATPEMRMRTALLTGHVNSARELLDKIPKSTREFYSVLIASPELQSEELFSRLRAAVQLMDGDVPVQFVSEAWFYVGCAALEARQPTAAAEAFRTSEKIGIESELYQIRNLYLRQTLR